MYKLMRLDYIIQYKKGRENIAADSLSPKRREEGNNMAITAIIPTWVQEVIDSYEGAPQIQRIITELLLDPSAQPSYSYNQGVLRYKERIYIRSVGNLREKLMDQMHASSLGGYSGMNHTYKREKQLFYWPGMKQDIERRVKNCEICIKNKVDGTPYAGLLQPLQIPTQAWQEISMDFVEALSKSEGKDTILVVVDTPTTRTLSLLLTSILCRK